LKPSFATPPTPTSVPGIPSIVPSTPIKFKLPKLSLGFFGRKPRKRKLLRFKRGYKYQPSLWGLELGKIEKSIRRIYTGLEIRGLPFLRKGRRRKRK